MSRHPSSSSSSSSSNIVSNLIRAAASIPVDVSDAELDKQVAELLAREAKEKEKKWQEFGYGGSSNTNRFHSAADESRPSTTSKPNTRFLSSIIRNVDDHNKTLLREQALAAEQARRESESSSTFSDRRERKHSSSSQRTREGDDRHSRSSGRYDSDEDGRDVRRNPESHAPEGSRPRRSEHSSSSSNRLFGASLRSLARDGEDREDARRRTGSRKVERSPKREQDEFRPSQDRSGSRRERVDRETDHPRESSSTARSQPSSVSALSESSRRNHHRRSSRSPERTSKDPGPDASSAHSLSRDAESKFSRSPQPPPPSSAPIPSKMDKYFSTSYDPALDFTGVLPVPKEGIIEQDVGWDRMIDVIKERELEKRYKSRVKDKEREKRDRKGHQRSRSERHRDSNYEEDDEEDDRRSVSSVHSSDSSDTRYRKRRLRKKEKKRRRREREQKDSVNDDLLKGYEYARRGDVKEWDKDKVDPF